MSRKPRHGIFWAIEPGHFFGDQRAEKAESQAGRQRLSREAEKEALEDVEQQVADADQDEEQGEQHGRVESRRRRIGEQSHVTSKEKRETRLDGAWWGHEKIMEGCEKD